MGAMELADGSIVELAAATSIQHMMLDYDNRLQRYTGQPMKLLRELVTRYSRNPHKFIVNINLEFYNHFSK